MGQITVSHSVIVGTHYSCIICLVLFQLSPTGPVSTIWDLWQNCNNEFIRVFIQGNPNNSWYHICSLYHRLWWKIILPRFCEWKVIVALTSYLHKGECQAWKNSGNDEEFLCYSVIYFYEQHILRIFMNWRDSKLHINATDYLRITSVSI